MGWNGQGKAGSSLNDSCESRCSRKSNRAQKLVWLAVEIFFISAIFVSAFLLMSKKDVEPSLQPEIHPKTAVLPTSKTNKIINTNLPQPTITQKTKKKDRYSGAQVISSVTNNDGTVFTDYLLSDGSRITRKTLPAPIFSNSCDQVIAMIVTSRSQNRIPPLPPLNEAEIRKSFQEGFLNPIRVTKEDSPRATALKMAVKDIRKAIADNIKAGDDTSIVKMIKDHVATHNQNLQLRTDAIAELKKACENATPEEQSSYLEAVNTHLEKLGIDKITSLNSSRPNKTESIPQ